MKRVVFILIFAALFVGNSWAQHTPSAPSSNAHSSSGGDGDGATKAGPSAGAALGWSFLPLAWVGLAASIGFHALLQVRDVRSWAQIMLTPAEELAVNITFPVVYVGFFVVAVCQRGQGRHEGAGGGGGSGGGRAGWASASAFSLTPRSWGSWFEQQRRPFGEQKLLAYHAYVRRILFPSHPRRWRVRAKGAGKKAGSKSAAGVGEGEGAGSQDEYEYEYEYEAATYDALGALEQPKGEHPTALHTQTWLPLVSASDTLGFIARQKEARRWALERKKRRKAKAAKAATKRSSSSSSSSFGRGRLGMGMGMGMGTPAKAKVMPGELRVENIEEEGDGEKGEKGEKGRNGGSERKYELELEHEHERERELEQYEREQTGEVDGDFITPGDGLQRLPSGPMTMPTNMLALVKSLARRQNPDAVFFPSRLLTGLVISVIITGISCKLMIDVAVDLETSVEAAVTKAHATQVNFVRTMTEQFVGANGIELASEELDRKVIEQLRTLVDAGSGLARAIPPSMSVGLAIAFVANVASWLYLLTDFQSIVVHARRGQWDLTAYFHDKPWCYWEQHIHKGSNFPGLMYMNNLLCFVLLTFFFGFLTTLIVWKFTRNLAWGFVQSEAFLKFVVTFTVNMLIVKEVIVNKVLIGKHGIRYRGLYACWDLYNYLVKIYLSFVTAALRIVMGLIGALLTLPFVNLYCMPTWLPMLLDNGYYAFMVMCIEYHSFNNPIVRVALVLMEEGPQRRCAAAKGDDSEGDLDGSDEEEGDDDAKDQKDQSRVQAAIGEVRQRCSQMLAPPRHDDDGVEAIQLQQHRRLCSPKKWRWCLYWRLLLLLHHNPHLIRYRAHHLLSRVEADMDAAAEGEGAGAKAAAEGSE